MSKSFKIKVEAEEVKVKKPWAVKTQLRSGSGFHEPKKRSRSSQKSNFQQKVRNGEYDGI